MSTFQSNLHQAMAHIHIHIHHTQTYTHTQPCLSCTRTCCILRCARMAFLDSWCCCSAAASSGVLATWEWYITRPSHSPSSIFTICSSSKTRATTDGQQDDFGSARVHILLKHFLRRYVNSAEDVALHIQSHSQLRHTHNIAKPATHTLAPPAPDAARFRAGALCWCAQLHCRALNLGPRSPCWPLRPPPHFPAWAY